jgi:hypothetical protein
MTSLILMTPRLTTGKMSRSASKMSRAQRNSHLGPPKHGRWHRKLTLISRGLLLRSHTALLPGSLVHRSRGRGRGQNRVYAQGLILQDGLLDLLIYPRISRTILTQHLPLIFPLQLSPILMTRCQIWIVPSEAPETTSIRHGSTPVVAVGSLEIGTLTMRSTHPRYQTMFPTEGAILLTPERVRGTSTINIVALLLHGEMTKPTVGQVIAIFENNSSLICWWLAPSCPSFRSHSTSVIIGTDAHVVVYVCI